MDLPEKAKRAPSAPVWNQSFPSRLTSVTLGGNVILSHQVPVNSQFTHQMATAAICKSDFLRTLWRVWPTVTSVYHVLTVVSLTETIELRDSPVKILFSTILQHQTTTLANNNIQRVHEKRPPKYNGVVFEILAKNIIEFLQQNLAHICTLCARIRGHLTKKIVFYYMFSIIRSKHKFP